MLSKKYETVLIDAENLAESVPDGVNFVSSEFDKTVKEIFDDMVNRNNTYYDAGKNRDSLSEFKDKVIIILGFKQFYDYLTPDSKDKLKVIFDNTQAFYGLHFILSDKESSFKSFTYENWFGRIISRTEGIWLGEGVTDQSILRISSFNKNLYEEIGENFAYVIHKSKPSLIKYISAVK